MEQFHQQGSRGVTVIVGNRMDVESGSEVKFPFRVSHSVEVKRSEVDSGVMFMRDCSECHEGRPGNLHTTVSPCLESEEVLQVCVLQ